MAANPNPIFSKAGAIGGIASTTLLTATGDYTGIGANNMLNQYYITAMGNRRRN